MFNILKPKTSAYEFRAKEKTRWQRAMHIHPTVSELLPTMFGELKPLE